MPELPEIETTRRGIAPHILKQKIKNVIIRQAQLRWPIYNKLAQCVRHQIVTAVNRRGKYLLISLTNGTMLFHLGMSGRLCIISANQTAQKHDHVDVTFTNGQCLRFTDPRRFGSLHWTSNDPLQHRLLQHLGPEPLSCEFSAEYLFEKSRNRYSAIKVFIMDSKIVVGVGNIYANEALFHSRINPLKPAGDITLKHCAKLVAAIKSTLEQAIERGGTTLRDFLSAEGKPGYFQQTLAVYDKADQPCPQCGHVIESVRLGQRSTFFCRDCQR